jgi:hypothetical protein
MKGRVTLAGSEILVHWLGATRAFDLVVIPALFCMFFSDQIKIESLLGEILTVHLRFLIILP